jgi:hypothetical protein
MACADCLLCLQVVAQTKHGVFARCPTCRASYRVAGEEEQRGPHVPDNHAALLDDPSARSAKRCLN